MNKVRLFLPIFMLSLLAGLPAYGAEMAPQGVMARMTESAKQAAMFVTDKAGQGKQKAIEQFDESIARFKRCMKGNCTKAEALKVARDVTIAAGAVIAAVYVVGSGLKGFWKVKEVPYASDNQNMSDRDAVAAFINANSIRPGDTINVDFIHPTTLNSSNPTKGGRAQGVYRGVNSDGSIELKQLSGEKSFFPLKNFFGEYIIEKSE